MGIQCTRKSSFTHHTFHREVGIPVGGRRSGRGYWIGSAKRGTGGVVHFAFLMMICCHDYLYDYILHALTLTRSPCPKSVLQSSCIVSSWTELSFLYDHPALTRSPISLSDQTNLGPLFVPATRPILSTLGAPQTMTFPVSLSTTPWDTSQGTEDNLEGNHPPKREVREMDDSDEVEPGIPLLRAEGDEVEFWSGEALALSSSDSAWRRSSSSIDWIPCR